MVQIELRVPGPPGCQFIVHYCCTRVLLYAKMLKEIEKHRLFCHICIIGVISNGGGRPVATPMSKRWAEAPAEIFSGGGKRRIHYLLDKIKPYNCNQDFAKGFEPKVVTQFLKNAEIWAAFCAN